MRHFTLFFHTKSSCVLHLSILTGYISGGLAFPEEDQREVGARPFSVWPRSRIKQESISKFCHVSYYFGIVITFAFGHVV